MSRSAKSTQREHLRDEELSTWGKEQSIDIERLDEGQKWFVFASLQILALVGEVAPLRRIMGYFLMHCGLDLRSKLIGALVQTTDRNIRYHANRTAEELWQSVSSPIRGHRPHKLGPEHAGPVAKYLIKHPGVRVNSILQFISTELGIDIDRQTLRRYIKRYGLGCLRDNKHEQAPLF